MAEAGMRRFERVESDLRKNTLFSVGSAAHCGIIPPMFRSAVPITGQSARDSGLAWRPAAPAHRLRTAADLPGASFRFFRRWLAVVLLILIHVAAPTGYAQTYTATSIPVSFSDITATGTALGLSDDSISGAIPLPFAFNFYGTNYNSVYISSNGFITFLDSQSNGCCAGQIVPNATSPDGFIAGAWNDIYPPGNGAVMYETQGAVGSRVFIVMFKDVPNCCGNAAAYTFNIKLFEGSNIAEVHIVDANSDGSVITVGIENTDGTDGIQSYSGVASVNNVAFRYSAGEPPTVTTLAATAVVPTGALLNGSVNPNSDGTDVHFEYSTDPGLAGASSTPGQNIGSGNAAMPVNAAVTELVPNTTYYFRAVGTNAAGTTHGSILSFTTYTLNFGGAGSSASGGVLDATLIPSSGVQTFVNVNGLGYDIVVTTSGLNRAGSASYFGDAGWWFEGGSPTSGYGTVTFRFYQTGTTNPYSLSGVDFRLLDAEVNERFRNFGYWDAENNYLGTTVGGGILSFSHNPVYHATDGSYDNNAAREGGDQMGKWIEMNLSNLAISGFTFQAHRQTSSAGSVIMSDLVAPWAGWRTQYFGAAPFPAAADDFANPDSDGPLNIFEYFYGTDPTSPDLPDPLVTTFIAGKLAVTFPRNVSATDATATVQGADNVNGPWTDLARSVNGAPFVALILGVDVFETGTGLIRDVEVRDLYLVGDPMHPTRFMRLRIVH
jgi:hypothetical protein